MFSTILSVWVIYKLKIRSKIYKIPHMDKYQVWSSDHYKSFNILKTRLCAVASDSTIHTSSPAVSWISKYLQRYGPRCIGCPKVLTESRSYSYQIWNLAGFRRILTWHNFSFFENWLKLFSNLSFCTEQLWENFRISYKEKREKWNPISIFCWKSFKSRDRKWRKDILKFIQMNKSTCLY